MKKNILIIGGTGFLGYHIAKACLKLKWNVVSLSLNKPKKIRKLKRIKYIILNISIKKNLNKLNNYQFNYVINLGGYVNHTNSLEVKKYHYLGVKNLFEYFKKKKLDSFIQVGSSLEYGKSKIPHKENFKCKPLGIYGKNKFKASRFLLKKYLNHKFPLTIIRLYQVYGPNQDLNRFIPILIQSSLRKIFFYSSNGVQKRDFLFVSDAVSAFLKTLSSKKSKGKIINIGYGKSVKLKNIMNYVGRETKFFSPICGKIKLREDEYLDIYPEIKKAKKILNWKPKIHWKLGISKTILYFKNFNAKR